MFSDKPFERITMKYNSYFLISVLIYFAAFSSQVTRAQNYTRPDIIHCNCTLVTVSSKVFSSTVLPWGFDWRINDENSTSVLVSVTIRSENEPFIITSGPNSSYSKRYIISNYPNRLNSTSTPFTSTVIITGIKEDETLTLSVPGLQSDPLTCEYFVDDAAETPMLEPEIPRNSTRPQEDYRNCTSFTVTSLVYPSRNPPWGFFWRVHEFNSTSEENGVLLAGVTVLRNLTIITTDQPYSIYTSRYQISNSPGQVDSASASFNSTLTINGLLANESITVSANGLRSDNFSLPQCSLELSDTTSRVLCKPPCTCGSEATLVCRHDGMTVDTVCLEDGTFMDSCPIEGKTISDGGKIVIAIVTAALFATAIWVARKKWMVAPVINKTPELKTMDSDGLNIKAGDTIQIDVPYYARPQPFITWTKNNHELGKSVTINDADGVSQLVVQNAQGFHSGVYNVTLSNAAGLQTLSVNVTVSVAPVINMTPELEAMDSDGLNINAGGTIQIDVPYYALPEPFIIWTKNYHELGESATNNDADGVSQLVVQNAQEFHSGVYTVTVINVAGLQTLSVDVTVSDPPSPCGRNIDMDSTTNDSNSITCDKASNLRTDKECKFRFIADNAAGESDPSRPSKAILACDPVEGPREASDLELINSTKSTLSFQWKGAENQGRADFLGYDIELKKEGSEEWIKYNDNHISGTSYTVRGLEHGASYSVRIRSPNMRSYSRWYRYKGTFIAQEFNDTKQDQENWQIQRDEITSRHAPATNPYENETLQG